MLMFALATNATTSCRHKLEVLSGPVQKRLVVGRLQCCLLLNLNLMFANENQLLEVFALSVSF